MPNPHSASESIGAVPSNGNTVLRLLSHVSFVCGLAAFIAYYAYPGFLNALWYFRILPSLAFVSGFLGLLALSGPWQPSKFDDSFIELDRLGSYFSARVFGRCCHIRRHNQTWSVLDNAESPIKYRRDNPACRLDQNRPRNCARAPSGKHWLRTWGSSDQQFNRRFPIQRHRFGNCSLRRGDDRCSGADACPAAFSC